VVEGAPLLREYRVKSSIEGSNPSLSARYDKGPNRGLCRIWRRERCGRNLRVRQIRQERIWTAERLARALCARVRLRDEPSISLSMLGWISVRAFVVSGGERGVDETSGVDKFVGNEFGQPNGWPERCSRGLGSGMSRAYPSRCWVGAPSGPFSYLAEREVWTKPPG
jgi:hypothetical protein